MRVIQVVNVRWFNATAWYGVELARLARNAGHESLVLGLEGTEPLRRAEALGLEVKALPLNAGSPLAWPGLARRMRALVRDFRPDVVNCHRGEAFVMWAALRGTGERFALVRTRGDQRLPRGNLPNRMLHERFADAVVATNSRMAEHFRTVMHVPEERLYTIYGGVDTGRFVFDAAARARVRAEWGCPEGEFVVGLLGRFDRVKGQKETIEAVARLVREGLPVRLVLIGFTTATTEDEVRTWIDEAGIGDRVRITGKVADVAACLSALDAGVVASLWSEAIARAALEIMACDRPLLSTDVGVMPDLLPKEALCSPGDVLALAGLIRRAAGDPAWCEHLRAVNRVRMPGLSSEAFRQHTLAVYRDACVRQGIPAGA